MSVFITSCVHDSNELTPIGSSDLLSLEFQFTNKKVENSSDSRVSEVRFLAFENSTGRCIKNQLLTFEGKNDPQIPLGNSKSLSDSIELEEGTYDFLFIANESSEMVDDDFRNKLSRVGNFTEMSQPPFKVQSFDGSLTDRIVMSAYYSNLELKQAQKPPFNVKLVRSFSKVEVVFVNKDETATYKRITKVHLHNIPAKYNVPALPASFFELYGDANTNFKTLTLDATFSEGDYEKDTIGALEFYIPELLRYKKDESTENNITLHIEGHGFLDLKRELLDTEVESINKQPRIPLENVFSLSSKSAIRNTIYRYTVKLSRSGSLEAVLDILPWILVDSDKGFAKPDWNKDIFSVKVGDADYTKASGDSIGKAPEIPLKTGQEAVITFKLDKPKGSEWIASLTNGRDFKFGLVENGEDGTEYKINVKAANPWTGSVKYSEFYIAVDGEELALWETAMGNSAGEGGIGKRYVFKQIE